MSGVLEIALLLAAIAAAIYLGRGFASDSLRERREREHLGRLTGRGAGEPAPAEPGIVARKLRAAGLAGPLELYLFGVSVFAVGVSLLVWSLIPGIPGLALIAFAFGLYLPWIVAKEWARVRSRRFERKLIDSIDLMAGALYAGSNLGGAFRSASNASEEPVKSEFAEVERRLSVGMPIARALSRMVEAYDGEGVRLFAQTVAAKAQAGGDLAPILRSLNETLRDRYRQQRQLDSHLAGAKISAIAAALLPYLLLPILIWLRPEWLRAMQMHPLGLPLLTFAIMLQMIGLLWVWRIVNREY